MNFSIVNLQINFFVLLVAFLNGLKQYLVHREDKRRGEVVSVLVEGRKGPAARDPWVRRTRKGREVDLNRSSGAGTGLAEKENRLSGNTGRVSV